MRLSGIAVSPGYGSGIAVALQGSDSAVHRRPIPKEDISTEVVRFEDAINLSRNQIETLKKGACERIGEEMGAIFDVHLLLLKDGAFVDKAISNIKEGSNAEWALKEAIEALKKGFAFMEDPYFRDRVADLEDVYLRLLGNLKGGKKENVIPSNEPIIVIARNLSPSDVVSLSKANVVAFATEIGGKTSHTVILAKSLEIPAVIGIHNLLEVCMDGSRVVVDGILGEVFINPTQEEEKILTEREEAYKKHKATMLSYKGIPAKTRDGIRVKMLVNIDLLPEIEGATGPEVDGVGLYRSEFLFLSSAPAIPSEEEHFETYMTLARSYAPRQVIIRTLDLGGEKYFHSVLSSEDKNPVLGLRAIRFCLSKPDIFMPQLKGILRASALGNVSIMFPMVSCVDEILKARELLESAKADLTERGLPYNPDIKIGIMVEVPSIVFLIPQMAKYVDFFSIGTNDLMQYLLAVDRNNDAVTYLYRPLHPSFLRAIQMICSEAEKFNKPVSCCGEVASEPVLAPVLVALGVSELSMTVTSLPDVKKKLIDTSVKQIKKALKRAINLSTADEVAELLHPLLTAEE